MFIMSVRSTSLSFLFFNDTATTEIYTLSLHDALPICRTVSPIIDGNLVIVSTPTSTWGTQANRAQRFIALDKRTGAIVWITTPGGRPYDPSYGPMNIVTINGPRLLITGGSDGAALEIKPQTGEPVFNLTVAKRGLNTGLVVN